MFGTWGSSKRQNKRKDTDSVDENGLKTFEHSNGPRALYPWEQGKVLIISLIVFTYIYLFWGLNISGFTSYSSCLLENIFFRYNDSRDISLVGCTADCQRSERCKCNVVCVRR
jgi:hypothetical protein